MQHLQASALTWHGGHVTAAERERLLDNVPATIWLTGLSASGKSTLAYAMERQLIDRGRACYVLDGDNMRHGLNSNLGFSATDRAENIRRIAEVARLMNDAGLIVLVAVISPYIADRAVARDIIGTGRFHEVHVSTSLSVCESRDTKGLYVKARSGEIANFTGISSPYEVPELADLAIDTAKITVDAAMSCLLRLINVDLVKRLTVTRPE